jgi:hypothetical protein
MPDHVVFLGDMVAKGPQPLEVVRLAMSLNASCVVGNHDYDLLSTLGYIQTVGDTEANTKDVPNELVVGLEEHTLGTRFERKAAEWMLRCPYILKVGDVGGEELVAVHAGLLPGRPLRKQGDISSYHANSRTLDYNEYPQYCQGKRITRHRGRRSLGQGLE